MAGEEERLGIIAGAGTLPIAIAETVTAKGRDVFVVAIKGMADEAGVARFPHVWVALGEFGRTAALLKEAGCRVVTFAGRVARPDLSKVKFDAKGTLFLPRLVAGALRGDDALMRAVLAFFEGEGLRVIGSDDVARDLIAGGGALGRLSPDKEHEADIAVGMNVVRALGEHDVGQAAVVCGGLVLAVEAVEGTDAMLKRVAGLPQDLRGTREQKKGVLVKTAKPHQERRVDLPVIGVKTIELAADAGLAGVTIEAGATLILGRKEVIAAADRLGLFLLGVERKGSR
jgi:DUF1009 family protein